jgi:hypothetical protein
MKERRRPRKGSVRDPLEQRAFDAKARTASTEFAISFEYHDLCPISGQRKRRTKAAQGAADDNGAN